MADSRPILPPPLKPGDTIGLISPAGPVTDQQKYEAGLAILSRMGFGVKPLRSRRPVCGYLAADDRERADQLQRLWNDDEVGAVMAVRGGFGCLRMMDLLDLQSISATAKMLIGFSDISVLLNALAAHTGLVTFHGPVLTTLADLDDASLLRLRRLLLEGPLKSLRADNLRIVRPGSAAGRLFGGNLTTIVHLLTTRWEIPWEKTILLLEDTGESMYRIDRMLTQLHAGGRLAKISGMILGDFDTGKDRTGHRRLCKQVEDRVLELTAGLDIPVWGGFPAGHLRRNHIIPLGVDAVMDGENNILRITRPLL